MIRKYKTKIIAAVSIILVLAFAWFYDGMVSDRVVVNPVPAATDIETSDVGDGILAEYQRDVEDIVPYDNDETETPEPTPVAETTTPTAEPDTTHLVAPEHLTHPQARTPVEPEDMVVGDGSFYVILSVRVDTLLHNMHLLHHDKHELVPDDGVIFPAIQVRAYEGESVFNVLQREMRRHGIHMSSRFTPMFNSAYIEAINNIFEFDGGPLSGWMYRVNGWFPNFGASRYLLQPGDVIEWMYTVDLGRDVGGYFLSDR